MIKELLNTYGVTSRLINLVLNKRLPKKQRIDAAKQAEAHAFIAIRGYYFFSKFVEEKGLVEEFNEWQKPHIEELQKEIDNAKNIHN